MRNCILLGLLAVMAVALAAPCLGDALQTAPAKQVKKAPDVGPTLKDVHTLARWACILSALGLIGVLWVGWSLKDIARNQVQLGQLIQGQPPEKEE